MRQRACTEAGFKLNAGKHACSGIVGWAQLFDDSSVTCGRAMAALGGSATAGAGTSFRHPAAPDQCSLARTERLAAPQGRHRCATWRQEPRLGGPCRPPPLAPLRQLSLFHSSPSCRCHRLLAVRRVLMGAQPWLRCRAAAATPLNLAQLGAEVAPASGLPRSAVQFRPPAGPLEQSGTCAGRCDELADQEGWGESTKESRAACRRAE